MSTKGISPHAPAAPDAPQVVLCARGDDRVDAREDNTTQQTRRLCIFHLLCHTVDLLPHRDVPLACAHLMGEKDTVEVERGGRQK